MHARHELSTSCCAQHIGQDTPLPSSSRLGIEEVGFELRLRATGCAAPFQLPSRGARRRCLRDGKRVRRWCSSGCLTMERIRHSAFRGSCKSRQYPRFGHRQSSAAARQARSKRPHPPRRVSPDDIREIERRIQKATEQSANDVNLPEAPVGIPEAFEDHIKLMFDLLVLAYRSEITRISTMMYARDTSGATYPASGVRDGFHGASHHSNVRANMDRFALINKYHVQMLAYFLDKLKATPDGDGNLLDHSVVLYGSSMSNGNQHDHDPLPILVAGGASGAMKGSRHLVFPAHTPMSNLMLSLLDKLGVHQDSFGDSTSKLEV